MANRARIALAIPGCLVLAGLAIGLVLALFDRHPIWPRQRLNLSEAAAVRDVAEIVRLIESSEDPDAARDVRPGLLADTAVRATPLEAAVAMRDPEIARVLLANGAVMDAPVWTRLRCAADGEEMTAYLDRRRPAKAIMDCTVLLSANSSK